MITINIKDGSGSRPKDPYCGNAYDPKIGDVIKFVAEDGSEYHIMACGDSGYHCHECVFDGRTGHPLSKIFRNTCDANVIRVLCYGRVYKPLDTIMENL